MPIVLSRDGTKIAYNLRGRGDPLALIMGFSAAGRAWGEPFLQLIERQFQTLVIDNRGTGDSDKPDRPWTLKDMADDIAAVLDHAGIQRSNIFGISMGGMIAQELVLHYPARVRGLVLGCTNCGASHSIPAPMEVVANLMPNLQLSALEQAERALSVASSKEWRESPQGQAFLAQLMADAANYPLPPPHTYMRQFGAIQSFDSFARLSEINTPTLVIAGDADSLIPVKNSEILNQGIAGSKVHILKGAGHVFNWEQPETTAEVVGGFLKNIS
jgi:3-oxoadipate enol-lactonase